jgi:aspartate aminotransferase
MGAPEAIAKAVDSIQSHSTSNPCSFAQKGAVAALKGDQQPLSDMHDEFDMRRNYMYDRISKIANITAVRPQGAFYVLVNISQLGLNSQNFSDRLLSKANVAVIPGAAFGDDRTIRLSYATSIDVIKKGLDRFQDFCRAVGGFSTVIEGSRGLQLAVETNDAQVLNPSPFAAQDDKWHPVFRPHSSRSFALCQASG